MAREVDVTHTNWPTVVQHLNPERPIVFSGSRQKPVFKLAGSDGTVYRIPGNELQKIMLRGKIPIWLMAYLVELGMVEASAEQSSARLGL